MSTAGERVGVSGARVGVGGFTLIELLVVIAIIALLMGILLPSLGAARDLGRQLVETSNQRQLAVASGSYAADEADYLHPIQTNIYRNGRSGTINGRPYSSPPGYAETTWRVSLWAYAGEVPEVYDSPSEATELYSDGVSDYDVLKSAGKTTQVIPYLFGDPQDIGLVRAEHFNRSGIGANGVHYWKYPAGDKAGFEGRAPFGRAYGPNFRQPEMDSDAANGSWGLSLVSQIEASDQCILYGSGGTDDPSFTEDTWWIYSLQYGPGVRRQGFSRYLQFVNNSSDTGSVRHGGKGVYAFADGSTKVLDPRDIPCNKDKCWWSVKIDGHRYWPTP